jgi:predicted permease
MLIASVPVATNSVILATEFTKKEEIASLGVLVTAILSLITIPIWQLIVESVI